ncbi:MAG: serine/threonine protein kinase [Bacteroidales bacterium]|nr:serine/threonine protein kinase [Bacteroidales bacterium]MBR6248897.1 serine/threonine protein kinase [Muribaculaceae bacterium]
MHLLEGTLLQSGRYRIESVLGQGGFGITYRATQVMLGRTVAIKEFFFRSCCSRESNTNSVTVPTEANKELVDRFKRKFIKEAQIISSLNHKSVVQIYDVFEENGTAYYVMECIEGQSLSEMVEARVVIPQAEAIDYITAVGDALMYIHARHINHLDVKPNNIMRCNDGRIVLLDFGVSKQYDAVTDKGTSTTPVGISHGYSPLEHYRRDGVQTFSPQSDVYALAATLYKLLTGDTPPEAASVHEDGIPLEPLQIRGIAPNVIQAIVTAMMPRRQRTQSVAEFISQLKAIPAVIQPQTSPDNPLNDVTIVGDAPRPVINDTSTPSIRHNQTNPQPRPNPQPRSNPQPQQARQQEANPQPQQRIVRHDSPSHAAAPQTEQKKNGLPRVVIFVLVLAALLAAAGYMGYKYWQASQDAIQAQEDTESIQLAQPDNGEAPTSSSSSSTPTQQRVVVKEQQQSQPQTKSQSRPAQPSQARPAQSQQNRSATARDAAKKSQTSTDHSGEAKKAGDKAQERRETAKGNTQPTVSTTSTTEKPSNQPTQRRREE